MYLIQGKAANVEKYRFLESANSCLRGLTYDRRLEGFDFLPQSSYAQGRNHLYRVALDDPCRCAYYIFMDDDVLFVRGSFSQLQRNLLRYKPTVGLPITVKTRPSVKGIEYKTKIYPFVRKQRFFINDEQYIAVSRAVLEEGKIFPYLEQYDDQSWFVTCLVQEALIQLYYHNTAWQFNDCEILNLYSGDYPHNLQFAMDAYQEYMRAHYGERRTWTATYHTLLRLDDWPQGLFGNIRQCVRGYIGSSTLYRTARLQCSGRLACTTSAKHVKESPFD